MYPKMNYSFSLVCAPRCDASIYSRLLKRGPQHILRHASPVSCCFFIGGKPLSGGKICVPENIEMEQIFTLHSLFFCPLYALRRWATLTERCFHGEVYSQTRGRCSFYFLGAANHWVTETKMGTDSVETDDGKAVCYLFMHSCSSIRLKP